MIIVDVHAHVGPTQDNPHAMQQKAGNPHSSVEHYLRAMDEAGVDIGVTFGYLDLDNRYQSRIAKEHADRIVSLAWIDPRRDDAVEEFRRCVEELGIRGLKLHGWWHTFRMSDHELLDPLFEICDRHGLPVIAHTMGDNPFTTPIQVEEMARSWPRVTVFLCHAGIPWIADEAIMVCKRTPNLIIDTSTTESWWITHFAEVLGPDRVAMGSDWPWNHLDAVVKTHELSIPEGTAREMVMGGTAARVFGLRTS